MFINFLLSDEAQLIFAREGLGPVVNAVDAKVPDDLQPLVAAKPMGTSDWRREQKLLQLAKEIFK